MTVDVIELTEYHAQFLAADRLPQEAAELLAHRYQTQIGLEAPSIFNNNRWKLVSQGGVGYLPLTRDLHLALLPKVPLGNVLRMLELVYDLSDFKVLEGLYEASSLDDFFERLAKILAHKVLDRFRRGIYRTYEPQADDLPYVRGRLDMVKTLVRPGRVDLACDFEEHTADGEDNQLLAWTLEQILRSGRCTEGRSLGYVRQAVRRFHGVVTPSPFHAQACVGRAYHRLNTDYRPLHALCYFFLSHTGPTHRQGEHEMVPFLVGMARLFEQFVARWLAQRLAPQYRVEGQ